MSDHGVDRSTIIVVVGTVLGGIIGVIGLVSAGADTTTIERASEPVADTTAQILGASPSMGSAVLLSLGLAAVVVAFAAAWLLE